MYRRENISLHGTVTEDIDLDQRSLIYYGYHSPNIHFTITIMYEREVWIQNFLALFVV